MRTRKLRHCAICDTLISPFHKVCYKHYKMYIEHKGTDWMQYLIETEKEQYLQDKKEITFITKYIESRGLDTYRLNNVTRTVTKEKIALAKQMKLDKYTYEKIAKHFNIHRMTAIRWIKTK